MLFHHMVWLVGTSDLNVYTASVISITQHTMLLGLVSAFEISGEYNAYIFMMNMF
jgi:PIN domain nuclease of toxin-antitoxin system